MAATQKKEAVAEEVSSSISNYRSDNKNNSTCYSPKKAIMNRISEIVGKEGILQYFHIQKILEKEEYKYHDIMNVFMLHKQEIDNLIEICKQQIQPPRQKNQLMQFNNNIKDDNYSNKLMMIDIKSIASNVAEEKQQQKQQQQFSFIRSEQHPLIQIEEGEDDKYKETSSYVVIEQQQQTQEDDNYTNNRIAQRQGRSVSLHFNHHSKNARESRSRSPNRRQHETIKQNE
ncbi:hypothetical protein ABPG72_015333 [Tetrahymena utriculariae]